MQHLLCLGDSYTFGEALALHQAFPAQTVQALRMQGLPFAAPEVFAKTGWTTHELIEAMQDYSFLPKYDFVTLLIGVNNQYRTLPLQQFIDEFTQLLNKAIQFASNEKNVAVLSIPDWGATPFAEGRDRKKISEEIAVYNREKYNICAAHNVTFLHTASSFNSIKNNAALTALDGLHPSAEEYRLWAQQVVYFIAGLTVVAR